MLREDNEIIPVVLQKFEGRNFRYICQKNEQTTSKCSFKKKTAFEKVFRKMRVFHSSIKIKDIIRTFLKCLVNGLCLGFVIWQIIKCYTKYIEKPQGTDVGQRKISDLPFPAITVCGEFGKDSYNGIKGLNNTYLRDTCR